MAECTGVGRYITPPAPKSAKDNLMEALGVQEIELTMTNDNGEKVTAIVLGRIEEE